MHCRPFTLNALLQVYRDWIRKAEYLSDLSWYVSCGDHKAIVINVMLNLPHNPAAFRETFGDDGDRLWGEFKRRYTEVCRREFRAEDETHFVPLWRQEMLTASQVRPLSVAQSNAFDAAMRENRLDSYSGPRPLPAGAGMAWPMETPIDLVYGFVSTYLGFIDVGGVVSAAALLHLAGQAWERLQVSEEQYCRLVRPIVSRLLAAEAMVHARGQEDWIGLIKNQLSQLVADLMTTADNCGGTSCDVNRVIDECCQDIHEQLPELVRKPAASRAEACAWLRTELSEALTVLRAQTESGKLAGHFFATPGIFHRIAAGAYPHSKFVHITPVCTAIDQRELELVE
jgi:hypothetical protein